MTMALECSKDISVDPSADEPSGECGEECDHSFIVKDDLGLVCRICGIIHRELKPYLSSNIVRGKGVHELTCVNRRMRTAQSQLRVCQLQSSLLGGI
ncbi:hypothetical protein M0R45_008309 [Rubus argutus]|uniref:Uncharacterized protein n=1 Tax=Rubus argutus TaxID=59490 RepID=A0AAW1Y2C8_RUBAR